MSTMSSLLTSLMVLLTVAAPLAPRAATAVEAPGEADADEAPGEAAAIEKPDPAEVRRKIAALAAPDERVPQEERAPQWLSARRTRIVPQLIAALDDANPEVAKQCLEILRRVPESPELTTALVAKAGDEKSPLRYVALMELERSAADPRVVRLLQQASTQADRFPDRWSRAHWAWLAGQKVQAVEILKPAILKARPFDSGVVGIIRLLGDIGGPESIELLEPVAAGDHWERAAEAYKALAKIDSVNHGLTKDQMTLLSDRHLGKAGPEFWQRHMQDLSKLDANEIRPFLLQMLRGKEGEGQSTALAILAMSKDKAALPQIRKLVQDAGPFHRLQPVETLLSIDAGPESQELVLGLIEKHDQFGNNGQIASGIVAAEMPLDAKVTMLVAARARMETFDWIPNAIKGRMYQGEDVRDLLIALMDQETDLRSLAGYCEVATLDKQRRFAAQVRRAMKLLSSDPAVSQAAETTSPKICSAVKTILDAAATYDLKDLAPDVEALMSSRSPGIRLAAQAAGARLGARGAMKDLYAQLGAGEAAVRKQAATALLKIKPGDEAERSRREEAALSCLGKPAEDFALRVLTTCGGERSAQALLPVLDDPDVRRAVYAAWVLAQLPEKAAAEKGLRRVAIFAMFHHQEYQQGAGIDFPIAAGLEFHQMTDDLNATGEDDDLPAIPAQIPEGLLKPFDWDDAEQQFAVRCYQLSEAFKTPLRSLHVMDTDYFAWGWSGNDGRPREPMIMNQRHLPLLREIAAHDSHFERLMVAGKAVPYFKYRQTAARTIAAITGEKATYPGLAGEPLDSAAFPAPYPDQDELLARYLIDQFQHCRLPDKPQTDAEWRRLDIWQATASMLREKFGTSVLDAIRQEAARRKVNIQSWLPAGKS